MNDCINCCRFDVEELFTTEDGDEVCENCYELGLYLDGVYEMLDDLGVDTEDLDIGDEIVYAFDNLVPLSEFVEGWSEDDN